MVHLVEGTLLGKILPVVHLMGGIYVCNENWKWVTCGRRLLVHFEGCICEGKSYTSFVDITFTNRVNKMAYDEIYILLSLDKKKNLHNGIQKICKGD